MTVARLHPARATPDTPNATPTPAAVALAVPAGSGRAANRGAWVAAVAGHPDVAALRADSYRTLRGITWALARYADWTTLTTRPTWDRLATLAGVSRRTVARWLAWLQARGLLGVVETGSTPDLRPMALAHLQGNRAAVYVLCHPVADAQERAASFDVDEDGTPPLVVPYEK